MKLHAKAMKLMPGGVSSNARLWHKVCPIYSPCSIFIDNAKGSHIWDVDGNEYIDYRLGFGPVILGHSNPAVHKRIHEYDEKGIIYALDNPLEITVAKKIQKLVPSAEMIRYSVSGTEATMHAIRIARSYTKKEKILKFEGHYHGTNDYLLFSTDPGKKRSSKPHPASLGIPKVLEKLILVNQWNDFDEIEKTIKKEADNIAAIITEPIMGNSAVIPPKEGYLKFLKELCEKNNIVLIFDEVKTGFRVSKGGAQGFFGVMPHMSTFAKSLGNGYPISVIAGLEEIMDHVGPEKVVHGGTYASNPVSLAAADATLDEILSNHVHPKIEKFGSKLMKGIREILQEKKIDGIVQGYPSMFQVLFTTQERIYNYRDLLKCNLDLFAKLHVLLLSKGVMFDEDNGEPIFTCAAHDEKDLKHTLNAIEECLPIALETKMTEQKQRFK